MASNFVPLPSDFVDLSNAYSVEANSKLINVIGVCVDFLSPTRCQNGRQDYKIKFTLHDPAWPAGIGLPFSFFNKQLKQLPDIRDQGDVVILRNVKINVFRGQTTGWSNASSTWVVLPAAELDNIQSAQDLKDKGRWMGQEYGDPNNYLQGAKVALANEAELKYAKWIADQEDPSLWSKQQPRTQLEIANTMEENGGTAPARKEKFRTLDRLDLPVRRDCIFVDLLGEVRKIFSPNDLTTELYMTDYTTNDRLHDYQHAGDQAGRDGDPFGYIQDKTSNKWPGPWGKMTILVTCWGRQASVAAQIAHLGSFVYLRNVQIKMDRNGSRLEGNCRDDRDYPDKELIEVVKSGDEKRTELLRRKRAYEQKVEGAGISFYRDPNQATKKRQKDEPTEQQNDEPKSKRTKARNRKNKKAKLEALQQEKKHAAVTIARQEHSLLKSNNHIRCNQYEGVSCKPVIDILDPDILNRMTAKGNPYRLPFQNCTYKSKVRVVDFFPDNIADFAAPLRAGQYDELSDNEDFEEDWDIDPTQERNPQDLKWEWRFLLLVEDARTPAGADGRPTQMELLVADTDGDFLLNMDACDLRDKANQDELAKLKEKLFHLWGDLQERKEESSTTTEELRVKPSARPFECLIKEYGTSVLRPNRQAKDSVVYDRRFRLFGTALAV
ncbi:uncharacterized protein PV07_00526 [Cladophialophora immunda]|uniref:Protection of telomeres protein 1 n=1 Tax=Cladophialophora immunda TaxID=569365 RepID=A0A0D2CR64_9EURO|nr:uncharacterized protein PV07_00526 [Cladophialophora immunda]KIW33698.1 hypothetical protein PV07_00526 [Cladophialophora immunda]OQU94181.1 hypothetical protein CLAIMM_00575 [Cladophialophora immunda]